MIKDGVEDWGLAGGVGGKGRERGLVIFIDHVKVSVPICL